MRILLVKLLNHLPRHVFRSVIHKQNPAVRVDFAALTQCLHFSRSLLDVSEVPPAHYSGYYDI